MVHRASVDSSICDRRSDVRPIFMTRLSDDSGDRMTGGCAAVGRLDGDAQQPFLHELPRSHQVGALLEDHHHR